MTVLDALHGDLQAARLEAAAKAHSHKHAPTADHTTAAS